MKMYATLLRPGIAAAGLLLFFLCSAAAFGQAGINGGKPIITFNTTGAVSIKTQSPPAFPGGDGQLSDFIIGQIEEADQPIRLPRKVWLTASIDPTGKVTRLAPTYDSDPTLIKEMERIGRLMPRWNPGTINEQGIETKFQFLVRQ